MANMSYCRFENTYSDLMDCVEAMEAVLNGDKRTMSLSDSEYRYFRGMARLCREYLEIYEELSTDELRIFPQPDTDDEY